MDISLPVTTFFHNGSCIPYRTVAIKLLPEEKKIKFPQLDDKYRLSIIEFTRDSSKSVTLTSDGLKITFANDSTTLGLVSHLESAIANIMSNDDMISHSTQGGGIRASKSSKSNSDSSSKVPKKLDVLPNRKKEKQSSQQHIAQAHSARFGKLALQTQQHSRRSAIMIKSINSDSRQQSSNTFRVPDISEHEQQAKVWHTFDCLPLNDLQPNIVHRLYDMLFLSPLHQSHLHHHHHRRALRFFRKGKVLPQDNMAITTKAVHTSLRCRPKSRGVHGTNTLKALQPQ